MFLIRTAFWMGVVVLLLPTDKQQQAKLVGSAGVAIERMATFCDRNQQACAKGAELWAVAVKKAEFGMRVAIDLINERGQKSDADGVRSAAGEPTPTARLQPARDTLRPGDLKPAWRGGQRTGA